MAHLKQKHYEATAKIIREKLQISQYPEIIKEVARCMADYFATENPKFNRDKFLKQAGIVA